MTDADRPIFRVASTSYSGLGAVSGKEYESSIRSRCYAQDPHTGILGEIPGGMGGHYPAHWGTRGRDWRYNADGTEIAMTDGHGRRLHGN